MKRNVQNRKNSRYFVSISINGENKSSRKIKHFPSSGKPLSRLLVCGKNKKRRRSEREEEKI
jgi:hypothetical protein